MKQLKYPPNVHWEVTPACNHNCIHCYNYWRKSSELHFRTALSSEEYLKFAAVLINLKVNAVTITGGEPFIVWKLIRPAIELLIENKISVSINTNIALLNEEIASFLKQHNIGLFISFPCSNESICDFITNKKGSLNMILENLDYLFKEKMPFQLNIVASKINLDYIEPTVALLKERYSIKKIFITRVGKPINSDDSFDQYLLQREDINRLQEISVKVHKKHNIMVDTGCPYTPCSIVSQEAFDLFGYRKFCTAGKTSYAIDFEGNVKACPRDSNLYGNIFADDFQDIWKRMNMWRDDSILPIECKSCTEKDFCFGGCRVDSFPFTGKLDSLDSIANPQNLPIRFSRRPKPKFSFNDNDTFVVLSGFTAVKEEFGYRISNYGRYVFITNGFHDYLSTQTSFSLKSFMEHFNVDRDTACNVINKLLVNYVINKE